ncbi:MAG: hypothetical protein CMH49_06070 [Myxococcales bacterium]|nr:hypothetical protein [Myxococcales bacterium]
MIKLTPIEIERHEFKTVWRGYDPDEVRSFLAQVAHQLTTMVREQEKSEEALELKAQRLAQVEDYEIRLRDALIAASSLAEQSREEARRESELLIKEAELQAERILKEGRQSLHQLLSETQSLKRQRERLSVELRSIVESHLRMLENQEEHLRTAQEHWRDEEAEWHSMANSLLNDTPSSQPSTQDKGDTLLEARELTLALGNSLGEEFLATSPSKQTPVDQEILSPSIPEPLTNRPLSASRLDLPKTPLKGSSLSLKAPSLDPKGLESAKTSSGLGEASKEKSGLAKLQQVLSEVPRRVEDDSDRSEQTVNEAQTTTDVGTGQSQVDS